MLVVIIVIVMIMTILAIGVMSMNVSQSLSNQRQIDRIKAELLAHGIFWEEYMKITDGTSTLIDTGDDHADSELIGHKTFTYTITRNDPVDPAVHPGLGSVINYTVDVSWPK